MNDFVGGGTWKLALIKGMENILRRIEIFIGVCVCVFFFKITTKEAYYLIVRDNIKTSV